MQNEYSFEKGYDQVPGGKQKAFKAEIMAAIKITTHQAWMRRLRGITIPRVDEKKAIEAIFAKYGITKNIWGI